MEKYVEARGTLRDVVKAADEFAAKKHEGQVDKAGVPYINHPRAVASKLDGDVEKAVALLHDTVEDTDATVEEIKSIFGSEIADAVAVLTHPKDEPYMDYIRRIWTNRLARSVKLADLEHNMDLTRLNGKVTEKDLERVEKYKEARKILEEEP